MPSIATRVTAALVLAIVLAGCGSTHPSDPPVNAAEPIRGLHTPLSCAETVLATLARVLDRVYREGVSSERTLVAEHMIAASAPLREAVEAGNPLAAQTVARALVATGHMTNLLVGRAGRTLAEAGGPAVAPLLGTLGRRGGPPIGSFVTSVWSDKGFLAEGSGVAEGHVALGANGSPVAGTGPVPPAGAPAEGTLVHGATVYQYASFPAEAFPGRPLRVYLLRPQQSTAALCGPTSEDTLVNTLSRVARLIYDGELGGQRRTQVRRVQADGPLLRAVASRDPVATRRAIDRLLTQHVVRLRVSDSTGRLLSDVGGPYVLGPVTAPLRLAGRTVGRFVLSIQDDEGYLRLTRRLAGLRVLMFMGSQLVKNSLGPSPGEVPASGPYEYHGRSFRVYTLHAEAFPSGPLTVRVLMPIPYS